MEIFKLFESTISHIQLDHLSTKDLRRDQILDNYNEATKTLKTLIKAKESEIAYRRNLVEMLEKSKQIHDNKLFQAKQAYQLAKKHAPESLDLKTPPKIKLEPSHQMDVSTTPTTASIIPTLSSVYIPAATSTSTLPNIPPPLPFTASIPPPQAFTSSIPPPLPFTTMHQQQAQPMLISPPGLNSNQNSQTSPDLDIPLPNESLENRSSLDRRLSEFFKTYPNLTQAGVANPQSNSYQAPRTPERSKYPSSASSSSHSSSRSKRR